jgi:hypothetical protein
VRYLVTGTGHSATKWASEVLGSNGSVCGHEATWGYKKYLREAEATLDGESSWQAAAFLGTTEAKLIVHLVRDPLAVLTSWLQIPSDWHKDHRWAHDLLGVPKPCANRFENELAFVRRFWMWSVMIEARAIELGKVYVRVRAEDGPGPLLAACGVEQTDDWDDRAINTHRKAGTSELTWSDLSLSSDRIICQALASRWGYESEV